MKNQQQLLLALLLLALTSMAAVAGGMNTREPFLEEHDDEEVPVDGEMPMNGEMPMDDEMPMDGDMSVVDEGFAGNAPGAQIVSTDLEDVKKAVPMNGEMPGNNVMPELPAADAVEGFTGSMYAGF